MSSTMAGDFLNFLFFVCILINNLVTLSSSFAAILILYIISELSERFSLLVYQEMSSYSLNSEKLSEQFDRSAGKRRPIFFSRLEN